MLDTKKREAVGVDKRTVTQRIVSFFKACYQADNRDLNLPNFFSAKVENRLVLWSNEALSGELGRFPVPEEWAKECQANLEEYSKEKSLHLCGISLCGKAKVAGRNQTIVAPLVLIPVALHLEAEGYVAIPDFEKIRVNQSALRFLSPQDGKEDSALDTTLERFPVGPVSEGNLSEITALLESQFRDVDTTALLDYPSVYDEKQTKTFTRKASDVFYLLPTAGLGVLRASSVSLGVISELDFMSKEGPISPVVEGLFGPSQEPAPIPGEPLSPVTLNGAQAGILDAVRKRRHTLVVGPPGTGKSFTIAALAADFMRRGKSVLIVSQTDQAVDVIANKISEDFGLPDVAVRGGRSSYKKQLLARLENILGNVSAPTGKPVDLKSSLSKIRKLTKKIGALERRLEKREVLERKRGEFFTSDKEGLFARLSSDFYKWDLSRRRPYHVLTKSYLEALEKRNLTVRRYLGDSFDFYLRKTLREHRQSLVKFMRALRARTMNRKDAFFEESSFADAVLGAMPLWLMKLSDLASTLPFDSSLFDLVIVDEAGQCDMASSLPALQRAKRAVVVGDPKQLRHVSFLSRARQEMLKGRSGLPNDVVADLDFRKKSLLDYFLENISSQDGVHFLDEHFRSHPDIIEFSNRKFYDNRLKIMSRRPEALLQDSVFLERLDGNRNEKGINTEEAEAVIGRVRQLVEAEKDMPADLAQSVGILAPLRDQADHLEEAIAVAFGAETQERHRMLVGTPYSFQGEERDIMLLSIGLDDASHASAHYHVNKADVFNVSVTRARTKQYVFTSLTEAGERKGSLLSDYLGGVKAKDNGASLPRKQEKSPSDRFLAEVAGALAEAGIHLFSYDYHVAGLGVDLLVEHAGEFYCVDLIGFPGDLEEAFPLERYRMLERVGLRVFPLAYGAWVCDRQKAIGDLLAFIQNEGS
ncbi:hypothetical protein FUAX_11350 [Fulvitalea axinellae]|uniref:AAA+ ATPase domain-containing protein n=1 Tax=Fulvitalea axinellae TaxID=1182444 RepID=A0AAU9CKZ3_9BACT|nr:hypothetical protein FUAX_11350 [Fulvitalea axinellae]